MGIAVSMETKIDVLKEKVEIQQAKMGKTRKIVFVLP